MSNTDAMDELYEHITGECGPTPISEYSYPIEEMIDIYMHCNDCLVSLPEGVAPVEYADLAIGAMDNGWKIQVWCNRHSRNVAIFSLKSQLSNMTCDCEDHE